jgi:hypothetical protein
MSLPYRYCDLVDRMTASYLDTLVRPCTAARTCLVGSPQLHTAHGLVEITVEAFVPGPAA